MGTAAPASLVQAMRPPPATVKVKVFVPGVPVTVTAPAPNNEIL